MWTYSMVEVTIKTSKGEKLVKLKDNATVLDLKKEFATTAKKSIHRLSFKYEADGKTVRLEDDSKTLDSYGVSPSTVLIFKDLGPQIGYRTVFLLEYFGPIVFVSLFALRPQLIFGESASSAEFNWVALLGVISWNMHFIKRELETIFVHKFSRPTMPLSNLFKNCIYYWSFGAVIGYPLSDPKFSPPADIQVYIGFAIFVVSEIGNLICHLMLSNMRPSEGSTSRTIPRGFLFELVACPNYTFEVASWIGFSIFTNLTFSYIFTVIGFLQMADWAMKKHQGYKKAFDGEYTKLRRKAIVPFLY